MIFLTFVARPLSISVLLGMYRSPLRQMTVVSWAGLRGVASIVFAIYAVLYQVDLPFDLFNLVFCIVLFHFYSRLTSTMDFKEMSYDQPTS